MHTITRSKPSKPNPLSAFFKRKPQTPTSTLPSEPTSNTKPSAIQDSLDVKLTKARYLEANKILRKAVNDCGNQWGTFDFMDINRNLEYVHDSQLKNKIDMMLELYKDKVKDHRALGKCRHAIQSYFTAFSPFAKNLLKIAKESSAVFTI